MTRENPRTESPSIPLSEALLRFAGLPGKERTGHGCAPCGMRPRSKGEVFKRKKICPPRLCPLPPGERNQRKKIFTLTPALSEIRGINMSPSPLSSPAGGEDVRKKGHKPRRLSPGGPCGPPR